ncbi:thrombospondin type 3 repeat-containing protein, partial [Akkermansiaceae bacterium]|nr:thrombospondin type 3 repeat-containing protein [Akkermansiaceae bacterium]
MRHKQTTFLLAISIAISTPLSAQEIDTDGDGILDGAETNTGTYIDANDTGTDPLNPDTDGDGFNDGLEALLSTSDPTKPASKPLRTGLLDILAYWDFNEASEPTQTNDLIKGFEGTLMGTTSYTADGGGRSGAAGDKAIDMGSIEKNGTGITVEAGGIFNIAARQDQFAISFWQNLSAVTASSSFRALSPSTTGNQRGIGVHATWVNSNVYFDTAGCCNTTS